MKRLVLVLALAGCKDALTKDVEMFCTATTGTTWKTFAEIGPYVAERLKSDEFRALLMKPVDGTMDVWQFADEVRALMKKTGVTTCKTLDVILPPRR